MRIKESPNDKAKSCPSEVCVPKSLISKIFEPFLKSCPSEVRVSRGHVPRGLTVHKKLQEATKIYKKLQVFTISCKRL